jgi:hypothetical protein
MVETNPQQLMEQYLEAFKARNLEQCMDYFSADSTLEWMMGEYTGKDAIEEWHRDRFAADLKILRVEGFEVNGSSVALDVVVQSKRLAAWRIPTIGGHVTAELQDGKIQHTKFSVKSINPQQNWA